MRPINFGAGPATLPEEVLSEAAAEMLDWHGTGMSVMEMSHRGAAFAQIIGTAERDMRRLLQIPAHYEVLFMQGGAIAQNALVPLNLVGGHACADFICTGAWSERSVREAGRYTHAQVAASSKATGFDRIPERSDWQLDAKAAYLHICGNETIGGVEFHYVPRDLGPVRLVADLSSEIMSRPIDVASYGLIFAGAQKNLGVAGVTFVIVDPDLFGRAHPLCPAIFNYQQVAAAESMVNTPPTYAIYLSGLVLAWLCRQAKEGEDPLDIMQQRSVAKSSALYAAIDASSLYENQVQIADRSRMNVPFRLVEEGLDDMFLDEAKAANLLQLKGHKSVGGMRASLYNAMPEQGVQQLIEFMSDFEKRRA